MFPYFAPIAVFSLALFGSPDASNGLTTTPVTTGKKLVVPMSKNPVVSSSSGPDLQSWTNQAQNTLRCGAIAALLVLGGMSSSATPAYAAVEEAAEIRGTKLTPFNSLTFNYRGNDFPGLDANTIHGPSVSYKEFLERLSAGEVEYVEFLAPDGDEAYVTFKAKEGEGKPAPIQIGEGFPVEQHDGWSSPAFAIRSVKEKGVPYKFVVPGLDKYK